MQGSQLVIGGCVALLAAALALAFVWRKERFQTPPSEPDLDLKQVLARYCWYVAVAMTAGVLVGVSVIGTGGRLIMRLLAFTSSPEAQGRITEADEVVGVITVGGTFGFILFFGVLGGIVLALLYLVVRRFLPPGVLGGIIYGVILVLTLGPVVDPLRRENPDFDIVEPGWLAALTFLSLAVIYGATLAAFMGRVSRWLPLPSKDRSAISRYVGPALIAAIAYPITAILTVFGAVVALASRWKPIVRVSCSGRLLVGGRALLVVVTGIASFYALPTFMDIATR